MIHGIVRATRWDPDEAHTSKGTRYFKTGSARVEVTIPNTTQSIHDLCNQPVIITTQPELDALLASARADAARAWERVRVLEARINTGRPSSEESCATLHARSVEEDMTDAQAISRLSSLRESNRIRSWSLIDNGDGGKVTISKNASSIGEAVAQALEAIP